MSDDLDEIAEGWPPDEPCAYEGITLERLDAIERDVLTWTHGGCMTIALELIAELRHLIAELDKPEAAEGSR